MCYVLCSVYIIEMKKISLIAVAAMVVLTGCKTTEANYRRAYEMAVKDREDSDPVANTIYESIRREALPAAVVTADGDTLRYKSEHLTVTKDQGLDAIPVMKRYCVVTGQFKQQFNAKAMAKRLRDMGYESAFVIQTAEPLYYVVALTTDSPADATAAERALAEDKSLMLREPCPMVVRPIGL